MYWIGIFIRYYLVYIKNRKFILETINNSFSVSEYAPSNILSLLSSVNLREPNGLKEL